MYGEDWLGWIYGMEDRGRSRVMQDGGRAGTKRHEISTDPLEQHRQR